MPGNPTRVTFDLSWKEMENKTHLSALLFPDWWCDCLGTEEPTEADIAFWTEVWETHRRIVSPNTKPKSRNQIIKWLRDPHSDAAEYRMWGNGVALPCVCFVLAGIVYCTQ